MARARGVTGWVVAVVVLVGGLGGCAGVTVPRGAPGAQAPGQMRVVDGGVVYETPTSTGAMTFQEAGAEWLWMAGPDPDRESRRDERAQEAKVTPVVPGGS